MKLLFPMTYARPYVSGPIAYAENLGRELLRRGHQVTFLTSRHLADLLGEETWEGIRIVRLPVAARLSKGVIMPTLPFAAARLVSAHDVIVVQVPQLEAPLYALLGRALRKRVLLTVHCDVQLPAGLANRAIGELLHAGHRLAASAAHAVAAYTEEYARYSRLLAPCWRKVKVIPPPVELAAPQPEQVAGFRRRHGLEGRKVIGICGRLSAEKGFEHLLAALPLLQREFPGACVVHAGETRAVAGEASYCRWIQPRIERAGPSWISAGVLTREELPAFYGACDATVLCSVNRTESFGFVQIESMLSGTPVVASDMPGVRVPVRTTGMGLLAPPGDPQALAAALLAVLRDPQRFHRPRPALEALYGAARTADGYQALLASAP